MLVGTGLVSSTAAGLRAELTTRHRYAINHCNMHRSDSSTLLLLGLSTDSPQPTGYHGRAFWPGLPVALAADGSSTSHRLLAGRHPNSGVSPSDVGPARSSSSTQESGPTFRRHYGWSSSRCRSSLSSRASGGRPTSNGGYLDLPYCPDRHKFLYGQQCRKLLCFPRAIFQVPTPAAKARGPSCTGRHFVMRHLASSMACGLATRPVTLHPAYLDR